MFAIITTTLVKQFLDFSVDRTRCQKYKWGSSCHPLSGLLWHPRVELKASILVPWPPGFWIFVFNIAPSGKYTPCLRLLHRVQGKSPGSITNTQSEAQSVLWSAANDSRTDFTTNGKVKTAVRKRKGIMLVTKGYWQYLYSFFIIVHKHNV